MTNREKHACFNLIVTATVIVAFVFLLLVRGLFEASIVLSFLSLWGVGPILFLARPRNDIPAGFDIHRRASKHGLVATLAGVGVTVGGVWAVGATPNLLQVAVAVIIPSWIVFVIAHGVSTLAQYSRRRAVG